MKLAGSFVLDSFALLAYLEGEAGAEVVEGVLSSAERNESRVSMSVLNLGEVAYITERVQGLEAAHRALAIADQLPLRIIDADRALALEAAHIKARHPLSYADTFAVALARRLSGRVVTGDPEFESVDHLVPVVWLSRS